MLKKIDLLDVIEDVMVEFMNIVMAIVIAILLLTQPSFNSITDKMFVFDSTSSVGAYTASTGKLVTEGGSIAPFKF